MTETRQLLRHFLAALAYRAQKALRGAPESFADFRVGPTTRTPHELLWHMTGVIGYARTMLRGGTFTPPRVSFAEEIVRFHDTLAALSADFADSSLAARVSDQQFLQGPLSDAMTHAGQLAMLRRLAGSPVASEDFIYAEIRPDNVSADQPAPAAPDGWWRPDDPPQPPGAHLLHQREQDDAIPRRIVGFHTDEEGHWVAELECGHGQHVRHDPPWQNRPWVITPEGRARFLGTELRCRKCVNEGRRA